MRRPSEIDALVELLGYRDAVKETDGGWWSNCPVPHENGDGPVHCGRQMFVRQLDDGVRFEPVCGHTVEEVVAAVAVTTSPTRAREGHRDAPPPLRNPDPSTARPVRWAWQHRVAIGKLNLLVGNEGTGKGVVNAWQASMLSHGRLDGDLKGTAVNVLIVGDEDALEDTWTPRLYAAEADWRRVFFPPHDIGDLDVTTDEGISTLNTWVRDYEIGVVVFDALLDNLGSCDAYEPRQVRGALRPLRRFAADRDVAVLGSLHPRKGDALSFRDLVAGSHQFNAVSRSSLLIAEHPDDKRRRVLLRGKGNLSILPEPLEFEIKSCAFQLNGATFDQPLATDWGTADIDLEDVLPRRSRESKQESAGHWLRAYLSRGDWLPSAEVKEAGQRAGFGERILQRALEELVEDGEAETRNTDTVPRRTVWRLTPPAGASRDTPLPPSLSRLDEPALESQKAGPVAPVATVATAKSGGVATDGRCACFPPPSRRPGETVCRYCREPVR
jgi:hypothetical protein